MRGNRIQANSRRLSERMRAKSVASRSTHALATWSAILTALLKIGLNYQVGTGGARMSIPDRQKIAIGRALVKRPTVLILDQAAAVLDPAAQNRLVASVLAYRKGLSVYWVLNRADLANRFGLVLFMDRGQLVERGSFDELMAKGGMLRDLLQPG